ncbi:MAG: protein TonB [Flavobacteriales bacterium]|jgi:protein TonB
MSAPDSGDRLSFTLFLAVAFHALVIFGITFKAHQGEKVAPTLNITLATHKSKKAPEKADFLAQHNQQASGTAENVKELSTTELSKMADVRIHEISPKPTTRATSAQDKNTEIIKTRAHSQVKVSPTKNPNNDESKEQQRDGEDEDAVLNSDKISSLQAKLDKLRQEMARKPRVTRHTSVSAKASDEAEYYNQWSNKVVSVGNKNFPEEALRKEIFGSLRLSVRIKANGTIAAIELLESSGHKILDDAAIRIVRLSSPFRPFPPEIRKKTDIFEIIRTWEFEITGLSTR